MIIYKYIIITGASTGIGAELSIQLSAPGVTLGLFGNKSEAQLNQVADECRSLGAVVQCFLADVCNADVMAECINIFIKKNSRIDLVIANAGVAIVVNDIYSETDAARINMQINYFGVINTILPCLNNMKQNNNGQIAIISSISSLRATQNSGPYSASKSAINFWAESKRLALHDYGIRFSILRVGFVKTKMTSGNQFNMIGIVSAQYAAKKIVNAIKMKKIDVALPWQSALLWKFFSILPDRLYDFLIVNAKNRIDRRVSK